jgi:hypothetical protein
MNRKKATPGAAIPGGLTHSRPDCVDQAAGTAFAPPRGNEEHQSCNDA